MRRDPEVVARMAAAEVGGTGDWMDVVAAEQRKIAARHGVDLVKMRARGRYSNLVPWSKVRCNRETAPTLQVGDSWCEFTVPVYRADDPTAPLSLHSLNDAPEFRTGKGPKANRLWIWSSGS